MAFKNKKKEKTFRGKDGVLWLLDDDGNKVKKIKNKVKRTQSNHSMSSMEQEATTVNSSSSAIHNPEMISSFRTATTSATAASSIYSTASEASDVAAAPTSNRSNTSRNSGSTTKSTTSKRKTSVKEIDGQLWRVDEEGKRIKRVRKRVETTDTTTPAKTIGKKDHDKAKRRGSTGDSGMLTSQTEHGTASSKGKKGIRSSVRQLGNHQLPSSSHPQQQQQQQQQQQPSGPHLSSVRKMRSAGELDRLSWSTSGKQHHIVPSPNPASKAGMSRMMEQSFNQSFNLSCDQTFGEPLKTGRSKKSEPRSAPINEYLDQKLSSKSGNRGTSRSLPGGLGSSNNNRDKGGQCLNGSNHKKKLPKNVKEIDGVLWRVDGEGNKVKKVRRKNEHDMDSTTENSRRGRKRNPTKNNESWDDDGGDSSIRSKSGHTAVSLPAQPRRGKSKERGASRSDTKHEGGNSSSTNDDEGGGSGTPEPQRRKLRRLKSENELNLSWNAFVNKVQNDDNHPVRRARRGGLVRSASSGGGLDMLMSQSVREHIRKVSSAEKPSLKKGNASLGDFFRRSGRSHSRDPSRDGRSRESKGRSRTGKSKKDKDAGSNKEKKGKDLPKNIKEIDGVLWRVDDQGNKLKKVRRKSVGGEIDTYDSQDDDGSLISQSSRRGRSRKDSIQTAASGDSVAGKSRGRRRPSCIGGGSSSNHKHSSQHSKQSTRRKESERSRRSDDTDGTDDFDDDDSFAIDILTSNSKRNINEFSENSLNLDNLIERFNESDLSLYHDATPSVPRRTKSSDCGPGSHHLGDSLKKGKSRRSATSNASGVFDGSFSMHFSDMAPDAIFDIQENLQDDLMASKMEVSRLSKVTKQQKNKIDGFASDTKKLKTKLRNETEEKSRLEAEVERLKNELCLKDKEVTHKEADLLKQQELVALERKAVGGGIIHESGQVSELAQENRRLIQKMGEEKSHFATRLKSKEDEVRFLQEELNRMRVEQGERDFEYMQQQSQMQLQIQSQSENAAEPVGKNVIDKIFNPKGGDEGGGGRAHNRKKLKELIDRVNSLEATNEKLKRELREATLEIREEDDEEIRLAKEMAARAAIQNEQTKNKGGGVLEKFQLSRSLSRAHMRSSSPTRGDRSNIDGLWWNR